MNATQNVHLRMFINTQTAMDNYSNKWNSIPVFLARKNEFDEIIQRIVAQNEKTNPASIAVTENKADVRQGLAEKTIVVSGILQAYAAMNDDPVLADKVKITKTDLKNCRETEVETLVTPVIAEARNNLANLTDYMLTEDMIVEVETSLDNFKALIGQPRTIRNKAFAAKTVLGDLFDEANNLLDSQLDKLMIRFKFTDQDFYEEYTRARVIVD